MVGVTPALVLVVLMIVRLGVMKVQVDVRFFRESGAYGLVGSYIEMPLFISAHIAASGVVSR
jgi:hypothetical protein